MAGLYCLVRSARAPIVTGYAIGALQQFLRCGQQSLDLGLPSPVNIRALNRAIELAVNYLLDIRPPAAKRKGLFLWSASAGPEEQPPLSLGTSALCMHVLAKWGRYRGRVDLVNGVAATLKRVVVATAQSESGTIEIEGNQLAIWDQLHLTEGSISYLWYFFAPITVVTVLRFADHPDFVGCSEVGTFIRKFVDWISTHVRKVDSRSSGVSGGETLPDPSVWATGLSVIVLSRVLERLDLLVLVVTRQDGWQKHRWRKR